MQRIRVAAAAVLSVGWLAACNAPARDLAPEGLSASLNASDNANANANAGDPGSRREHELRTSPGAKSTGAGGGGSTGILYHGGRVLTNGINVVAVYWASSPIYAGGPAAGTTGSGASDGSNIGHFLRNLGGSPYYKINTTYKDAAGTSLANVVNYTGYWANNSNVPSNGQNVTDANIKAMLQSGFDGGKLTYDVNAIYTVFTAGTVNLGGGFGTQYCAYHTNYSVTIGGASKTILVAAMPYDYAYPTACTMFGGSTPPPNGDYGADSEVNTLAHEIEEAATDALGSAWYDRRGYENADKCAWTFGATYAAGGSAVANANMNLGGKHFLVQQNWVNAGSGGCFTSWP